MITILVAMKPVKDTFIENILEYGMAGINIDDCRVGRKKRVNSGMTSIGIMHDDDWKPKKICSEVQGRFPANIILEDCNEVKKRFPKTKSGSIRKDVQRGGFGHNGIYGKGNREGDGKDYNANSGSASRFFRQFKETNT